MPAAGRAQLKKLELALRPWKPLLIAAIVVGAGLLEALFIAKSPTNLDEGDIWVLLTFFGGLVLLVAIGNALWGGFSKENPMSTRVPLLLAGVVASGIFVFAIVSKVQTALLVEGTKDAFADFKAQIPTTRDESGAYLKGKVVVLNRLRYDMLNSQDWRQVEPGKVADLHFALPDALEAASPEEVQTIVWLGCDPETTGRYRSGTRAIKFDCDITVVDRARDVVIGTRHVEGGDPPKTISCNSCPEQVAGQLPFDDVLTYLEGLPRR